MRNAAANMNISRLLQSHHACDVRYKNEITDPKTVSPFFMRQAQVDAYVCTSAELFIMLSIFDLMAGKLRIPQRENSIQEIAIKNNLFAIAIR